eukprot:CAMPEP_0182423998 /NCGR_PEP_ID=MMETSP1167-20130531/10120_1 /TAXON_ID=2988 /ORGANISM="Mallomonas Sp, Strain CCMP3275" /LENGTH=305 /DNA_ID=CAMNT_0024603451 /DNA_START=402 /DNA_END=1319 /DNA_ORIENTATION=+
MCINNDSFEIILQARNSVFNLHPEIFLRLKHIHIIHNSFDFSPVFSSLSVESAELDRDTPKNIIRISVIYDGKRKTVKSLKQIRTNETSSSSISSSETDVGITELIASYCMSSLQTRHQWFRLHEINISDCEDLYDCHVIQLLRAVDETSNQFRCEILRLQRNRNLIDPLQYLREHNIKDETENATGNHSSVHPGESARTRTAWVRRWYLDGCWCVDVDKLYDVAAADDLWIDLCHDPLQVGEVVEVVILASRFKGEWVACRVLESRGDTYDIHVLQTELCSRAIGYSDSRVNDVKRRHLRHLCG